MNILGKFVLTISDIVLCEDLVQNNSLTSLYSTTQSQKAKKVIYSVILSSFQWDIYKSLTPTTWYYLIKEKKKIERPSE